MNHALEHYGMTKSVIAQVPKILEHPIVVMQSKQRDRRIVMFGEVNDENGVPVLAVMEIEPQKDNGEIIDLNLIINAYAKTEEIKQNGKVFVKKEKSIEKTGNLIKTSKILYLDTNKKRTDTWMQGLGLQLPSGTTMYGSIGTISYADDGVKIQGKTWEEVTIETQNRHEKSTQGYE